jgi:hypothetical protein
VLRKRYHEVAKKEIAMFKSRWLLITACLFAAFIGGALSNWAFSARRAWGQGNPQAATPPIVTVSGVSVVNTDGKVVAFLGISPLDGKTPKLQLMTTKGAQISMGFPIIPSSEEECPSILVGDKDGKLRCTMSCTSELSSLCLYDRFGTLRADLSADLFNLAKVGEQARMIESSLALYNRDGKVLYRTPLRAER